MEDLDPKIQQKLIEDFKENRDVFEKIYNFYYERIFGYLLKRTLSSEVAYDLTAETFMKAFESFHRFKWTGISIKVWLYRIAINALKNQRKEKIASPLDVIPQGNENLAMDVKEELREIDKALFGDEELSKLSDAIATLNPEQQNVISLYYFSGLSQKEISETINKSVSAVKTIMYRATKSLRELLIPNLA